MSVILKKRIFGLLKYHHSQPLGNGKAECVVCFTEYPCLTIQIAKGHIVWNDSMNRFEPKVEVLN
jgi:hypothetical protein